MAAMRRLSTLFLAFALAFTMLAPSQASRRNGPALRTPESGAMVNHPEFQWQAVPGATKYELQVATDHRFLNVYRSEQTDANRYISTDTWPADSYWWRVRVIEPFESDFSSARLFTRRWLQPDNGGSSVEVARPDRVRVEQAYLNALKISWDPVAEASYYVVQFDKVEDRDTEPGTLPPYEFVPDIVCITAHTVLTPNGLLTTDMTDGPLPTPMVEINEKWGCQITESGKYFARVRAVDVRAVGPPLYSLWSDEARSTDELSPPGPEAFVLGPAPSGSNADLPAEITAPRAGTTFVDSPTLEWKPVKWADFYRVNIALDRDFTSDYAWYHTTNTRLVPLNRLPEESAEQAYYWYVVPCVGNPSDGTGVCVSSSKAVNRPGRYSWFEKVSPEPVLMGGDTDGSAWTRVRMQPFSSTAFNTAVRLGDEHQSVGGFDAYELEAKPRGGDWTNLGITDVPVVVLPKDTLAWRQFKWRVRVIDGSGQVRPWSKSQSVEPNQAVPAKPLGLRAIREGRKVTLEWRQPRSRLLTIEGFNVYWSLRGRLWHKVDKDVKKTRIPLRLAKGRSYWFMVSARNAAGEGAPSKVLVRR